MYIKKYCCLCHSKKSDAKECIHLNKYFSCSVKSIYQNSLRQANQLTFEGGEKLCNTVFGTLGTVRSVCPPFLPPFLYSAS